MLHNKLKQVKMPAPFHAPCYILHALQMVCSNKVRPSFSGGCPTVGTAAQSVLKSQEPDGTLLFLAWDLRMDASITTWC